jgi:magnesium transporter
MGQINSNGVDGLAAPPDNAGMATSGVSPAARTTAIPPHEGFFVSEFLGETVRDVARHPVGRISDFAVATSTRAPFPRVTGLLIRDRFETFVLPWEDVAIFQRGTVRTRLVREDLLHRPAREDEIFLARHLLDKQIVDINGVKVVRVNDLKLDLLSGDLVLTAADVGVRGLVRRVFGAGITPRGGRLSDASLPARLIPWDSMAPLHPRLERLETTLPLEKLHRLHPADIADILSQVSGTERTGIFRKLDVGTAAETLHELEPEIQAEILEDLPERRASEILEQMPADEAADVLGEIEGEHARDLVQLMEKEARDEVTELLVHDENTAGGLMGTDFVTFPTGLTVRETLSRLRPVARDAEALFYFYVVDESEHLLGALSVRDILAADDDALLENTMKTPVRSVTTDVTADEVAETMSKYDLLALPVTDPEGVLIGIITIDDVVDRMKPQPRRHRRRLR